MAEKKGVGHAYNVDFLNVVFAASSIFLFLSVIWMVWDDFDWEWRKTQLRFVDLEYQVTQTQLEQAAKGVDKNKVAQLQAQESEARKGVEANQQKVSELEGQLKDADTRVYRATLDYQYVKATYDQNRYAFESARQHGSSSAEKMGAAVAEQEKRLNELNLAREKAEGDRAAILKQIGEITGKMTAVQKDIEALSTEQTRLTKRLGVIAPSALKDYFRNAPLVDFMAPTIKVQQIILPNVVDDVNFTRVPKMDRCGTCHLAIDKKGYEKYPHPLQMTQRHKQ